MSLNSRQTYWNKVNLAAYHLCEFNSRQCIAYRRYQRKQLGYKNRVIIIEIESL